MFVYLMTEMYCKLLELTIYNYFLFLFLLNTINRYLDDHELWTSTDFAVHCFKLIVNNVQVMQLQ